MDLIAIIGIGCRFPGAESPGDFWRLLRSGVNAITEVPADRWNIDEFYDPQPATPGKMNTRWGGFLKQVDRFDAGFFKISPREAQRMDPQQRLLMEVAWEALEDGGQAPDSLSGTQTGVFIGISNDDYGRMQLSDPALDDAYVGTGSALSIAANRLSYYFDFRGPSMAIDTACSSSLVAVHLACRSLSSGEATLALAGGVNLILTPAVTVNFSKAGFMAPDGLCKAFDSRADGYVRGEGVGIVVLKPLPQALADGDPIYAVIRGSAVNQDGHSNGLTAPNRWAQEAVLRQAYQNAGVSPGRVQYVEAHGTGTALGDPIEAKALGAVLAADRPADSDCLLGSVKTNIGHLESAAGIAGLIKVALSLKHCEIPPSLNFEQPNPYIPFDELPLRVATSLSQWPMSELPALAGISAFGFGGTNAHVVLEEAPQPGTEQRPTTAEDAPVFSLLPLSARSENALRESARSYRATLNDSATPLDDVFYTASVRRVHHEYRLAVVGQSRGELVGALDAYLREEARQEWISGVKPRGRRPKLAFVFPGQGGQWLGMGRRLLDQEPVFRASLEQSAKAIQQYVDWSLLAMLRAGEADARLEQIDVIQPMLFAIQVGLAALWKAWGITPDAVIGHSLGEVAAAHVAGSLSLDDAAKIICLRSRLMTRVSGRGGMAAVELTAEQAQSALAGYTDRLSIAVSNSPTSTVISGDADALQTVIDELQRQDVFCRLVKVDVAAHSPHMDPLRVELAQLLDGLESSPPSIPFYSTVMGEVAATLDAAYWARNLREPVLFASTVQKMIEDGWGTFLEISPHPILTGPVQQCLEHANQPGLALPSLRRDVEERAVMLQSLGALYVNGQVPDWRALTPAGRCVTLPMYPWQEERYWIEDDRLITARPAAKASASAVEPAPTERTRQRSETQAASAEPTIRQQLAAKPPEERLAALEAFSGDLVGKTLRLPSTQALDPNKPLDELGFDSLMVVGLKSRLEKALGINVPVMMFRKGVTIAQFARQLLDLIDQQAPLTAVEALAAAAGTASVSVERRSSRSNLGQTDSTLVPIQPGGSARPLFCVTAGYGDMLAFETLAQCLGADQPFYGLQPSSRVHYSGLEDLAADYVRAMRSVQPEGPYFLSGYCSGGIAAFAAAQQLEAEGQQVALLALLDTPFMVSRLDYLTYRLVQASIGRYLPEPQNTRSRLFHILWALFLDQGLENHLKVMKGYVPTSYREKITFITPQISFIRFSPARWRWPAVAHGRFETRLVPGDHDNFLRAGNVPGLAAVLRECMDRAQIVRP